MIPAFVVALVFAFISVLGFWAAASDPTGNPRFYGVWVVGSGAISVAALIIGTALMF